MRSRHSGPGRSHGPGSHTEGRPRTPASRTPGARVGLPPPPCERRRFRNGLGWCDRGLTSRMREARSSARQSRAETSAGTRALTVPGGHRTRTHRSVVGLPSMETRMPRRPIFTDRYGEPPRRGRPSWSVEISQAIPEDGRGEESDRDRPIAWLATGPTPVPRRPRCIGRSAGETLGSALRPSVPKSGVSDMARRRDHSALRLHITSSVVFGGDPALHAETSAALLGARENPRLAYRAAGARWPDGARERGGKPRGTPPPSPPPHHNPSQSMMIHGTRHRDSGRSRVS